MKLLYVTSEAAPYVKTGGLGDVSYALPAALAQEKNMDVAVIMPYYQSMLDDPEFKPALVASFAVQLGWRTLHCGLFDYVEPNSGVHYYFIDNRYYFDRYGLYGHYDDGERFAYFCKAVLESLPHMGEMPEIIHCNDWQTALIPLMLASQYYGRMEYQGIKTVFTIHNIEYQGKASDEFLGDVLGISEEWRGAARFGGCVNFMKSAIVLADKITTVSKTYSYEIRHAYFAFGLENMLQQYAYKIQGIINGIDPVAFNPEDDVLIHKTYSADTLEDKLENKRYLQRKLHLPVDTDIPIVAVISRLVAHKGMDLIEFVTNDLMRENLQLVIVGTGDQHYEDLFRRLAYHHPDKVSTNIVFDTELAHQVYAGSDILLMPSKSEPCGLAQMIAMRYGTIPVVRETGGLFDTVPALNVETLEGRGFTFKLFNAHDMLGAVCRAIDFYRDDEKRTQLMKKLMEIDFGWSEAVREYIAIYDGLLHANEG